ncbi:GNAT family N-acetyltransferase [Kiloniella antarctica]|uniref:GNAT family N-acetyltransferase n=1 Tax=Kiloniella antarctica TaxID=1550907 RepID=A0ABW5BQA4_9PROT
MIRRARPDDVRNLTVLSIHVWLHTYAKVGIIPAYSNYILQHFTEEKFLEAISNSDQEIWIYETNSALQGFLIMKKTSPCPQRLNCMTEIDNFYVHSNITRNGIGTALLNQAVKSCREKSISQVWLSVHHENSIAINFYNKHDFNNIGSLMFELEDGEYKNNILLKDLTSAL